MIKFDDFRRKFPLIGCKQMSEQASVCACAHFCAFCFSNGFRLLATQSNRLNLKRFYWYTRSSKYLRLLKSDCIRCAFFIVAFTTLVLLFYFLMSDFLISKFVRHRQTRYMLLLNKNYSIYRKHQCVYDMFTE